MSDKAEEQMQNAAGWQLGPRQSLVTAPAEMPEPGPDELLIQVSRIGLSHIDRRVAHDAAFPVPYPVILGASVAGTIVRVGSKVDRFVVGERVASYTTFYARKDRKDNRFGAFQKFTLSLATTTSKIPSQISDLTVAVSHVASAHLAAAALGHYVKLTGCGPPEFSQANDDNDKGSKRVLIYGGTSSIGGYAIQLASQAGYMVISTAGNAKNQAYVRTLGAHTVLDYHPSDQGPSLAALLSSYGPYTAVLDCISTTNTVDLLRKTLALTSSTTAPTIFHLLPIAPSNDHQSLSSGAGVAHIKTQFIWLSSVFVDPDHVAFTRWVFHEWLEEAMVSARFVPTPPLLIEGGLASLGAGLDMVPQVSAQKVVVALD